MAIRSNHETEDSTLLLPRILCLHGGGSNAQIFRAQCRILVRQLKSKFRLCFADGPYLSEPGPDVLPVYKDYGPFRRWVCWLPEHPEIDDKTAVNAIMDSLNAAMEVDNRKGATGEWTALLGFSQGAKMSASLLLRQQEREEQLGKGRAGSNFRFAVLLAGSAPFVSLGSELATTPALLDALQITTDQQVLGEQEPLLRLPTIHVHGTRDQGLLRHRRLLEDYCEKGSTRLIEWEGEHRVPIKSRDVIVIVNQILDVAKQTGLLRE